MTDASVCMSLPRHQRSGAHGLASAIVGMVVALVGCAMPMAGPAALPIALLVVAGLVSGWLAGLLGIGGALITLPTLYVALPALGIAPSNVPATAVATALVAMVPTTIVAAWRQHRRGAIDGAWLRRLAAPMTFGAAAGALAAACANGPVLGLAFAAQSLSYGTRLLYGRTVARGVDADCARPASVPPWLAGPAMAAFCACVGMGGGSLVPGYLQRRGVDFRRAVATGSALNLCIAVGGSAAFLLGADAVMQCSPCWLAGMVLGTCAIVAAPFGVDFAHRLKTRELTVAVATVNIASAVFIVAAVWRG